MLTKTLFAASVLTFSSLAMSASQTWNFQNQSSSLQNNALQLSVGGVNLTVTSWSSTGESGSCHSGPECRRGGRGYDNDPLIESTTLLAHGKGLGSVNRDEKAAVPDHAFDSYEIGKGAHLNESIDYDMALLEFDVAVNIKDFKLGWTGTGNQGGGADISVLSYSGSNDLGSNPFGNSSKWSDLLSNGWSHNGNYANVHMNQNTAISDSGESKYWLIGVYNPIFGGNLSYGDDAFKLAGITAHKGKGPDPQPGTIPEPATALLMLAGLVAVRKRKNS